ncbi:MAG: DUF4913 domain-containing protein, partial [Propionibacterium sp.]|nr:DUF4913 domain-containing protein [Propionibacterium sp.]
PVLDRLFAPDGPFVNCLGPAGHRPKDS